MPKPPVVRHVIFDLGAVLLNIDFQLTIDAFAALGIDPQRLAYHREEQSILFHGLETGHVSPEQFYTALQEIAPNARVEALENAWCALICDFPIARFRWLEQLSERYKLYILSNTNPIHIRQFEAMIEQEFGWARFRDLFVGIGYSHELKARKPDTEIYDRFLQLHSINRSQAVFVDDTLANVETASSLGIQSFHLEPGKEVTVEFDRWLNAYGGDGSGSGMPWA